ncbi:hypothetical protein [Okeania sp. KiyG1]|nr:hypothetical protein [Okeania sp. KiyG1]
MKAICREELAEKDEEYFNQKRERWLENRWGCVAIATPHSYVEQ